MCIVLLSLLLVIVKQSYGEIYHLNESEHALMPPVFHRDGYQNCAGVYCAVELWLYNDTPSALYDVMLQYSEHKLHYNRTRLYYGLCMPESCADDTKDDRKSILEGCLTRKISPYQLKAKVLQFYCSDEFNEIDKVDVIVAVVCGTLLLAVIVGSLQKNSENKLLSCFSIRNNWRKLVAPSVVKDPKLLGFQAFNGVRVLCTAIVCSIHTSFIFYHGVSNTRDIEELQIIKYTSSMFVVHVFFIMSAFLMAYNLQRDMDLKKLSGTFSELKSRLVKRWLRLSPLYVFALALSATWLRFDGRGPYHYLWFQAEYEDCRRDWWLVVLYLINYKVDSRCKPETWYLATEFQLTIITMLVIVMLRGRARVLVMAGLYVSGMVTSALHTYQHNLSGWVEAVPDFSFDPMFNYVYKPGHTNVSNYVLGAACGLLVRRIQKCGKEYREILSTLFQIASASLVPIVMAQCIFYQDGPELSLFVRLLYAALYKHVFGVAICVFIVSFALMIENSAAKFLSRQFWVIPARLSYAAYIGHVYVLKKYASQVEPLPVFSVGFFGYLAANFVIGEFALGLVLHLLVEAPIDNLIHKYTRLSH